MIQFRIDGEAVAQGRPRATAINGQARLYDPKKSRDYKAYVASVAEQHRPPTLLDGPLKMRIKVYKAIPKSYPKAKKQDAVSGLLRPINKPDADNYAKSIKDALTDVIWKDDSQIVDLYISKHYATEAYVEVTIDYVAAFKEQQKLSI